MLVLHLSDIGMLETNRLLKDLIELPSVNPAFLTKGDAQAGEDHVADYLACMGQSVGLEVQFQKVLPRRSNLIIRLAPRGKARKRILLAPHLDTVPAANQTQFTPRVVRGRLYGRGACDTKGSVAAMFAAICDLAHSKHRPQETEIVFAGLVDEENAQAGSRAFTSLGIKTDLAIVGEPTRLKVVTAHKGSLWLRLETRGKSAHGARPELGRNAVHAMARIVDLLETNYAERLRRRRHTLLGHATVNVGTIHGGTQPNIVPDFCSITVDRRTLPGETDKSVRLEIAALLARNKLQAKFSQAKLAPSSAMETKPSLALVRQFMQCANQTEAAGVDYFCDAAVLSEGGIPSVVFGPGDIAQAHTSNEWIALNELEGARKILLRFFQTLP